MNKHIVKDFEAGQRLDKLLSQILNISRAKIQTMFKDNLIFVDGKIAKASLKLNKGQVISFQDYEVPDLTVEPEAIDLDIIYEDEDVIVVNKPIGMVVHPANGHHQGTLVNALLYHFAKLSSLAGTIRPGIVHRIDKETSGLIMVAKNDAAHLALAKQLKDKSVYRRYLALVQGEVPHNEGSIIAPIGRLKSNRKKMAVVADGKEAVTHFKVLERFNGYTLLECLLESGRTHQIRVHLQYIKFPVVGDALYGSKKAPYKEQLLHAESLAFKHPRSGEMLKVQAPLPAYFEEALKNLREKAQL